MDILIDKVLKNFYMLQERNSIVKMEIYFCPWPLRKTQVHNFFYYLHIIEIPTNKGANSYKLAKIETRELNKILIF